MKAGTLEPTGKPAGSSASCSGSQEVQHAPKHLSAVLAVYLHLEGRTWCETGQFQKHPEAFGLLTCWVFWSFPVGCNVSPLLRTFCIFPSFPLRVNVLSRNKPIHSLPLPLLPGSSSLSTRQPWCPPHRKPEAYQKLWHCFSSQPFLLLCFKTMEGPRESPWTCWLSLTKWFIEPAPRRRMNFLNFSRRGST